jgi:ABC-2 type transport system ATP-binding protein
MELGPRKQRFTLALLALHVNQPVPVDRLVDLTWPHAPPRTARHAIHVRVSQLRAMFANAGADAKAEIEPMRINTRGSTYALHGDPMCVDAHRFRALVADAQVATTDAIRAEKLRRALALWHGPPLADVAAPADQVCQRLEEARLAATEEWVDAELRVGRHNAMIDQLVELTTEHPLRQRLVALLMLALYRDGRAPEALRTYQVARSRLADDFGLDPHTRLQELESAILRGDPSLELRDRTAVRTVHRTSSLVRHERRAQSRSTQVTWPWNDTYHPRRA